MALLNRNEAPFRRRLLAGAGGGIAGAAAYAAVLKIDLKVFGHQTDDLVLIGRLITGNDERIRPIGLGIHLINGAALGVLYSLVAEEHMPGSPVGKGLTFALLETFTLYPIAILQQIHPGFREGRLESYLTPVAFAQQIVRHIAYGAALGPVTDMVLKIR